MRVWRAWPLFHRRPIARFARGRVALLGDAAHPMVPFLAQGAAQAIEDAGALARRLGETDNVEAALAGYSRDRVARAGRVQREALAQGRIYHMSGPLGLARDLAMRTLGPERLLAREPRDSTLSAEKRAFAAEQFISMVVTLPQRRAMGYGTPMTAAELDVWADKTVDLFLDGCRGWTA